MSKRIIIFIIIAIVAVALISGAALVYKEKKEKPPKTETFTTSPQETSQTFTPPAIQKFSAKQGSDLMSDWKTYTNSKCGYSIKYPKDWYVKEEYRTKCNFKNCLENLYIENMKEKVIVAGGGSFTKNGSSFKILILGAPGISSIEEWIQNLDIPNKEKQRRLNSVESMEIFGVRTVVWKGAGTADAGVDFVRNDKFYRMHYMSGSQEQFNKDLDTFNQMLSSFKFIK